MTPSIRALAGAIALASALGGCVRGVVRPFVFSSGRILVVEALDRSFQGAGRPAADALADALEAQGTTVAGVVPRPASVLPATWLQDQGRRWQARAAVTANVSAWSLQPARHRAFVAMTGLALSLDGTLLWVQRVSATAPWQGYGAATDRWRYPGSFRWPPTGVMVAPASWPQNRQDGERALQAAALRAAKEFAVDLSRHF